jgi:hypothetical protein
MHSPIFGVTNDITSGDVDELARVYRFLKIKDTEEVRKRERAPPLA